MITIINLHRRKLPEGAVYIGRRLRYTQYEQSPLANPYGLRDDRDDQGRSHVLSQYTRWLDERLAAPESEQSIELARLVDLAKQGDLVLACWCFPSGCHGDVVKERIEQRLQELQQ